MVLATWARTMTRDDKTARSLEIAERDHLTYRAKYHGMSAQGEAKFSVPSRSQLHEYRIVRLSAQGGWQCGCPAATHGMPCGHIGSAAHLWQQISAAMSEAGQRAQRDYDAFADWLERRGY
jgi:hypothetical protein